MSHGAGHIMDMINRLKQNRAQRPSNRKKFKENNREGIYSAAESSQKPNFKTVPKEQLKKIKAQIRKKAKADKKREIRFFIEFILFFLVIILGIFMWTN